MLSDFVQDGVVVCESLFSDDEIKELRDKLHEQLATYNVHHEQLLTGHQTEVDGPRLKSKAASIFYHKWKLDAQMDSRVVSCAKTLLVETFGRKRPGFEHPFELFDDVCVYIDRVCYRLPDCVRSEGGLELHCDRNAKAPYANLQKWRPIQGLLTLTDHYGSDCGGLKVIPGFHRE